MRDLSSTGQAIPQPGPLIFAFKWSRLFVFNVRVFVGYLPQNAMFPALAISSVEGRYFQVYLHSSRNWKEIGEKIEVPPAIYRQAKSGIVVSGGLVQERHHVFP